MFLAILVLALGATIGISTSAGAKKKKKGAAKTKVFSGQTAPNAAIPDKPAGITPSTALTSTINVGKKFKGKVVGDLNVTGLQTTGSAAGAAFQLTARLSAPNGRTILLFRGHGDQSLGPWTLDDDTRTEICDTATPPCVNPNQTLNRPFAGTSNLVNNDQPSFIPLATFDGVGMRGTWTLTVVDTGSGGPLTSVLNQWGLQITPAKPVSA